MAPLQTEKKLGDYTLLRELGQGALGHTFLAEHRFLKKHFVLKLLEHNLCQIPDFVSRFEAEVAILAALDHPNIIKVHNVSEVDGTYFLVTEAMVDSLNLYDYLKMRKGSLAEDEVLSLITQIAVALDYAHLQGSCAHLSVKPSNILIAHKHVSISDFGLSRILGSPVYMSRMYQAIAESQLSFLHHYLFLAPEQRWSLMGSGMKSDVYAFGVLLYFALTGRYPEGVFEPVSALASHYQFDWDRVIRACLAMDPAKRPERLEPLLHPHPTEVEPTTFKPILNRAEIQRPEYEPDPAAIFQVEKTVAKYQPDTESKTDISPILTKMIVIAGGQFCRGSDQGERDEMPRHQVFLSPYAIDVHPITNEQFGQFLQAMGGEKDHQNNDIIHLKESRIKRASGKIVIESGYAKHPVVGVTWYGAVAYAKWVGKRLPTEAEWEIAALGGVTDYTFPTGKEILRSQANFFGSDTTPVMSYPPNGYGLYDMAGNVHEWCEDWYDYHSYDRSVQEPNNPKGPAQGVYKVLKGGGWQSLERDVRCSKRHRNNPGAKNKSTGFRCAADVVPYTAQA